MAKSKFANRFKVQSDWTHYNEMYVLLSKHPKITIVDSEEDYDDGRYCLFTIVTQFHLSEDELYDWIESSIFLTDVEITEDIPKECKFYTVQVAEIDAKDLSEILYVHKMIYYTEETPTYKDKDGCKARNVIIAACLSREQIADWISDTTIYDFDIRDGRYTSSF